MKPLTLVLFVALVAFGFSQPVLWVAAGVLAFIGLRDGTGGSEYREYRDRRDRQERFNRRYLRERPGAARRGGGGGGGGGGGTGGGGGGRF
ncbi:hypothetical protein ABT160_19820 [Streptomyces sp. NPDC001941]|uniref:hypothetical protein n=1 Tax=Streptomyces sp. NPDC001941 TaxID=3154659 RepID=UPI00332052A2